MKNTPNMNLFSKIKFYNLKDDLVYTHLTECRGQMSVTHSDQKWILQEVQGSGVNNAQF